MGSWGYKPLENDFALDLRDGFNESGDLNILENALDFVINLKKAEYLGAPEAQEAVAAAEILQNLALSQIPTEEKERLIQKTQIALERIVSNSELNELWSESPEYQNWVQSIKDLIKN